MSGHMRKRGANSWQLIVFNDFDSRGRRQYSRKTLHDTKKEAETLLAVYVLDVGHRSPNIVAEAATLTQVLEGWLEFRGPQLSPATVDRYRIAINHVRPALGRWRWSGWRHIISMTSTPSFIVRVCRARLSAKFTGRCDSRSYGPGDADTSRIWPQRALSCRRSEPPEFSRRHRTS